MSIGGDGDYFLRQLSSNGTATDSDAKGSKRWRKAKGAAASASSGWEVECGSGSDGYSGNTGAKKRVMVVIDQTAGTKHAMMWALTHVANKGDLLTLLHVVAPAEHHRRDETPMLASSLGALCKACKPEVEVEALVIQGPKLTTVLSQVRKLEASVLVLSQRSPSPLCCLFMSSHEEFVEQCINKADCLTLAVRKQSKGVSGYLISTRWQKNFWLLA